MFRSGIHGEVKTVSCDVGLDSICYRVYIEWDTICWASMEGLHCDYRYNEYIRTYTFQVNELWWFSSVSCYDSKIKKHHNHLICIKLFILHQLKSRTMSLGERELLEPNSHMCVVVNVGLKNMNWKEDLTQFRSTHTPPLSLKLNFGFVLHLQRSACCHSRRISKRIT